MVTRPRRCPQIEGVFQRVGEEESGGSAEHDCAVKEPPHREKRRGSAGGGDHEGASDEFDEGRFEGFRTDPFPAEREDQQGQEKCRESEGLQEDIGDVRACRPDKIVGSRRARCGIPGRIAWVKRGQAEQE